MDERRKSKKRRCEINKKGGEGREGRQEVREKEEKRRQQRLPKRNGDLTEKRSRGG